MIRLRHQQPSLWETFFAEEVAELWEPWMQVVDELLQDDELLDIVLRGTGEATSTEPDARTASNASGSGVADADSETCTELEL